MIIAQSGARRESSAAARWLGQFEAIEDQFRRLRGQAEFLVRTYAVGGRRLRFVAWSENALDRVDSTMRHLRCDDSAEEVLEVCVGHGECIELEPLWNRARETAGNAEIRPRLVLGDAMGLQGAVWPVAGMLGLIDRGSGRAVLWLRDVQQIRAAHAAALVRALVSWWRLDDDCVVVHAGAVAGPRGAVLLAGIGGTGKSSTAVACFEAGLDFIGDDAALCRVGSREVFSLSACASIFERDVTRHHSSLRRSLPEEVGLDGKVVLDLARIAPGRVVARAPLIALVRLTRGDTRDTRLAPVARPRVMAALAPSSVFNVPSPQALTFARISALVRSLPAYELHLAGDRSAAARALATLLQDGTVS